MTTIGIDGVEYAYSATGAGPAVLFLHGFTGSALEWDPFLAGTGDHRSAVALDLLGHGASSRPPDPSRYALERQAADLAGIVTRLDLGPVVVAGYSYGARIALRFALDHPRAVAGLILESPSAGIADPTERAARRAVDEALALDLERDGIDAFVERWAALPVFAAERRLQAAVLDELARRRRANDPAALAAALRGAGQGTMSPLHRDLALISAPTAILAGALDASGLARARIVAAGIPGASLDVLDDVGHAPHREAADRFAAWLTATLERIAPTTTGSSSLRRSA